LDRPATEQEQASLLTAAGLNFDGREVAENGEVWQEIETTSNRGDCLCHVGMAREICAMSGRSLKWSATHAAATSPAASTFIRVTNRDHAACPRYTVRVIRGVKIGPSPEWMQKRLRAIGQIPRNNVVDCTNFVLFELGQPTHVFDLDLLKGNEIQVRRAAPGEKFLPIGESAAEVLLRPTDLVIADAERPVAVAGVKGGALTAVTDRTTNIVLEAAAFSPAAVRAASRGLRISSDSSYRFERGVHPAEVDAAADRLAALILETAGGTLCEGVASDGAPIPAARTIEVRPARVNSLLGIEIPLIEIEEALRTLGFSPVVRGTVVVAHVPPRRMDIEREVDLIEEICRIHGLDRIPVKDVISLRVTPVQPTVAAPRAVKDALVGLGFVEAVTHTLVSERHAAPFLNAGALPLRIDEERAGGAPVLRPSILPSLLEVKRRNADNGTAHLKLFECAHVFCAAAPHERVQVALLTDEPFQEPLRWLRGACHRLVRLLAGNHAEIRVEPTPAGECAPYYHVQAQVHAQGTSIGHLGVLHPKVLATFGLEGPLACAELELSSLYAGYPPDARAQALPAFPGIDRDLSAIVPETTPWSHVEQIVKQLDLPCFESLTFVGVYRGKQTGAERKSVTMRLVFRAADRTLRREDVDASIALLSQALATQLGAELRS
jgi:phenylalanyl-tRNA synthetase beta chain